MDIPSGVGDLVHIAAVLAFQIGQNALDLTSGIIQIRRCLQFPRDRVRLGGRHDDHGHRVLCTIGLAVQIARQVGKAPVQGGAGYRQHVLVQCTVGFAVQLGKLLAVRSYVYAIVFLRAIAVFQDDFDIISITTIDAARASRLPNQAGLAVRPLLVELVIGDIRVFKAAVLQLDVVRYLQLRLVPFGRAVCTLDRRRNAVVVALVILHISEQGVIRNVDLLRVNIGAPVEVFAGNFLGFDGRPCARHAVEAVLPGVGNGIAFVELAAVHGGKHTVLRDGLYNGDRVILGQFFRLEFFVIVDEVDAGGFFIFAADNWIRVMFQTHATKVKLACCGSPGRTFTCTHGSDVVAIVAAIVRALVGVGAGVGLERALRGKIAECQAAAILQRLILAAKIMFDRRTVLIHIIYGNVEVVTPGNVERVAGRARLGRQRRRGVVRRLGRVRRRSLVGLGRLHAAGRAVGGHGALAGRAVGDHSALAGRAVRGHGALARRAVGSHGALAGRAVRSHGALAGRAVGGHSALARRAVRGHGALAGLAVGGRGALARRAVRSHGALAGRTVGSGLALGRLRLFLQALRLGGRRGRAGGGVGGGIFRPGGAGHAASHTERKQGTDHTFFHDVQLLFSGWSARTGGTGLR